MGIYEKSFKVILGFLSFFLILLLIISYYLAVWVVSKPTTVLLIAFSIVNFFILALVVLLFIVPSSIKALPSGLQINHILRSNLYQWEDISYSFFNKVIAASGMNTSSDFLLLEIKRNGRLLKKCSYPVTNIPDTDKALFKAGAKRKVDSSS